MINPTIVDILDYSNSESLLIKTREDVLLYAGKTENVPRYLFKKVVTHIGAQDGRVVLFIEETRPNSHFEKSF